RRILSEMVSSWRMQPAAAASAAEALTLMRSATQEGQPFPLALIDAHMPEMDGFELVHCIRQDPDLTQASIIMLSSAAHKRDAARCRELGIAAYLLKPLKQSELLAAMRTALGSLPARSTMPQPSMRQDNRASRSLRLLLAEDNAVNQNLVVRLLNKLGHQVVVVNNGREALAALEREPFDVVLMDCQMPEMDRYEAAREIRRRESQVPAVGGQWLARSDSLSDSLLATDTQQPTPRRIPIIAMTANAMKGDREKCLEAGMDDYLAKPIKPAELKTVLERGK
ncbi:MAG TPA: response regulator, partial [Candidatus Binatia bacterium]|nr:response regulator [Candidatus Binatia bacterium]